MIDMTRVTTRLSTAQGRSTASPDATPTSPPGSRTARATPSASTRPSPRRPARRGASRAAAGGAAAARRGPLVVLPTLATTAPSRRVPGRVLLGFGQSVRVYWGYHHGPALALPALPRSSSTDLRRDTGPGCLRPLWSQPVDGAARVVTDNDGVAVVWAAAEGGGTSALLAI